MHWLKHAFRVDAAPPEAPSEQLEVIDQLCKEIVRRGLATPAVMFLEMARPLNYLGAQAMHFFAPFLSALSQTSAHEHLARFLERRDAVDRLCRRIEELEQERSSQPPEESSAGPGTPVD